MSGPFLDVAHKMTVVSGIGHMDVVCTCRDESLASFDTLEVGLGDLTAVADDHLAKAGHLVDCIANATPGPHRTHVYDKDTRRHIEGLPSGGLSIWQVTTLCGNVIDGRDASMCSANEIGCGQCRRILRSKGLIT